MFTSNQNLEAAMAEAACPKCGDVDFELDPTDEEAERMLCGACGHQWSLTQKQMDAIVERAIRDANQRMN